MPHARNIVVHRKAVVHENVSIFHNVTLGGKGYGENPYPEILSGAALYVGCSVLGPVTVGERAKIGAHALVINDVPEDAIAVGVPANCSKEEM